MTAEPHTWRGWMMRPLRRYADFRGRSGRREFWWYSLFLTLGYLGIFSAAVAIMVIREGSVDEEVVVWTMMAGWLLFFAVNFIPGLALTTRRLHDMGVSGALLIAIFAGMAILNVLGWIAYMVWMSLPGQAKPNRWGPPLGAEDVAGVFG